MSEYVFKLPDLGEGTVEAEVVAWHVQVGDRVEEGQAVVDMMTDKANVEVPAPLAGQVVRISGAPGDLIAVGAELMALEVAGRAADTVTAPRPTGENVRADARAVSGRPDAEPCAIAPARANTAAVETAPEPAVDPAAPIDTPATADTAAVADAADGSPVHRQGVSGGARVVTSPAIRKRAKEAGIDLRDVPGTGPRGRILRSDFDAYLEQAPVAGKPGAAASAEPHAADDAGIERIRVVGVRRVIAERMARAKREIPHFSYVEEVDVTEVDALRRHLNSAHGRSLTLLPFVALALIRAVRRFPQCNARHDAEAGVIERHRAVHLGVATHTPDGLKVPVVRNADALDLWRLADAITRVATAARDNRARPADLGGSTITLTSLGRLGGIASTPVINLPEVAVVGVNRAAERPAVVNGQVVVRTLMNLSSSFDHRFVDGFDAAALIQAVREGLEHPGALFIAAPGAESGILGIHQTGDGA